MLRPPAVTTATATAEPQRPLGIFTRVSEFVFGRRLASEQEHAHRLSNISALAVLSSDALSSVAYATEELLLVLVIAGTVGLNWSVPVSVAIVCLLVMLTISYRQTIRAYPQGGGAYNVAKENLGTQAGLVAAAGLLIDYVLTAAVSATAGAAALSSAFPDFRDDKVPLAIGAITLLMVVNLRGIKSTGRLFTLPTLIFIVSMFVLLGVGIYRVISGTAAAPPPVLPIEVTGVGIFLALRAFSSGSTALTGVEAMANGVYVFRPPEASNARKTLLWMALILGTVFIGITWLAREFNIAPATDQTVISQIARIVFGGGPGYYLIQIATMLILLLAANTAFSGFPRVAGVLGRDNFLPRQLANTGWRLVYSNGIILLAIVSSVLVAVFGGDVHKLIPLYVVGVFMSFTLSQTGMVRHWLREKGKGWWSSAVINGVGAIATGSALVVIAITKFTHGAWAVILVILLFLLIFRSIRKHYEMVARELSLDSYVPELVPVRHTVVIPVGGVHRGVLEAVAYARSFSTDIRAVYVCTDPAGEAAVRAKWNKYVPDIQLEIIHSPYRLVIRPFLRFLDDRSRDGSQYITVVIPEFVPMHWWEWMLHSQTNWVLKLRLAFKKHVAVTTVPHQLAK